MKLQFIQTQSQVFMTLADRVNSNVLCFSIVRRKTQFGYFLAVPNYLEAEEYTVYKERDEIEFLGIFDRPPRPHPVGDALMAVCGGYIGFLYRTKYPIKFSQVPYS